MSSTIGKKIKCCLTDRIRCSIAELGSWVYVTHDNYVGRNLSDDLSHVYGITEVISGIRPIFKRAR